MAFFYSLCFLFLLGVAAGADNIDHVQIAVKSAQAASCEVTMYEHSHPSKNSDFTGDTEQFLGTGNHPVQGLFGVSSVEVKGQGCMAYGYTSADCSGEKSGNGVSSTTQVAGFAAGIVSSSDELVKYWGCNDCIRCVQVEQGDATPVPTAATPAPTAATPAPTAATPAPTAATPAPTAATPAPTTATPVPTNDPLRPTGEFYLVQPDHGPGYVGMCGGTTNGNCEGSSQGVFGYEIQEDRAVWVMEAGAGDMVYLKQPSHTAYIGMASGCGNKDCDNSKGDIYGYGSTKDSVTAWKVEAGDDDLIYLYQSAQAGYLGMCGGVGNGASCGTHKQRLFAYASKTERTRMKFVLKE